MAESRFNGSLVPYSKSGDHAQDEVHFGCARTFFVNLSTYSLFDTHLLSDITATVHLSPASSRQTNSGQTVARIRLLAPHSAR